MSAGGGNGAEAEMDERLGRSGSAGESGGGPREPLTGALPKIDIAKDRFPYCLVWSPLPCITYVMSVCGHSSTEGRKDRVVETAACPTPPVGCT